MRTTVDLPDSVYRRLKATAALRGVSLKQLLLESVTRDLAPRARPKRRAKFPLIPSKQPGTLRLTSSEIDEILFG